MQIHRWDHQSSCHNLSNSGRLAFVADGGFGLQVIDITNPKSPQIVGSVDTPGDAQDLALSGPYAYVADGGSGLQVIDITDPRKPWLVGGVTIPHNAFGVAVSSTHAFVAGSLSGLQVLPLQCPALSGVGEEDRRGSTILVRARPNPSSARTAIRFEIPGDGFVEAGVYDPAGRMVRRLSGAILRAGVHDLAWDGRTDDGRILTAGVYLIRISFAEEATVAHVLIVR